MKRISLNLPELKMHEVTLDVFFSAPLHPQINGNKPYKLKYNIAQMHTLGRHGLLTFGGAYSNHLAATAAMGHLHGFITIGVVRGERPAILNDVLLFCEAQGMDLHFISRTEYAKRSDAAWLQMWQDRFPDLLLVPEGGANAEGARGCRELLPDDAVAYDVVACAVGTGTTLAGITQMLQPHQHARGFAVLNDERYLTNEVNRFFENNFLMQSHWSISGAGICGGYAKQTPALMQVIAALQNEYALTCDAVYTGKLMFGLLHEIRAGLWDGKKILAIHTGGFRLTST